MGPLESLVVGDDSRVREQHAEMLSTLEELFTSSRYSDLNLKCGDKTYKVHKAVVCTRSTFFAQACGGMFKEGMSNTIELTSDGEDVVKTDDPELIGHLIDYFYRLDYLPTTEESFKKPATSLCKVTDQYGRQIQFPYNQFYYNRHLQSVRAATPDLIDPPTPRRPEENPLTHAEMYALGEYYGIPGLKAAALNKFKKCAENFWSSTQFAEAVHIVYSGTVDSDKGLRDIVADLLMKHISLIERPEYEALLLQHNGLSYGLLKAKVAAGMI